MLNLRACHLAQDPHTAMPGRNVVIAIVIVAVVVCHLPLDLQMAMVGS